MKLNHHTNALNGDLPVSVVNTPGIVSGSRIDRIVTGQWPVAIDASSASHDQWIVGILNGCIGMVPRDTTRCRKCGEVPPIGSQSRLIRLHGVRCNSSSSQPKAACWRPAPPALRGKYGYHHTIVLHFVRRLDFETRLAKGAPFGIPDFGDHDQDIIDHDPSGHWSWIAAADSANMRPDDERSLHECAKDRERRAIRTRSRPDCCRIDFDLISDHSAFVVDLFPINYLLNRQSI